jgi:hypothetical protein
MVPGLSSTSVRLFLTSAALLFVELLLIRWVPANVIYVGFFNNFVLLASFLGIGAGILLGRAGRAAPIPAGVPLLALVVLVLQVKIDPRVAAGAEHWLGYSAQNQIDVNFLVLLLVVVLVTAVMAVLALPLGPLLRAMPPLRAYAIDIAGSLVGIAAFAALALLATPPTVWFAVVAAVLGLRALPGRVGAGTFVGGAAMAGVLALAMSMQDRGDLWSPYYRVGLARADDGTEFVSVNGIVHQAMWPAASPNKEVLYEQIYRWFPQRIFRNTLIVGAGTGTDTAVALAHGVARVDAVEIDPEILRLGVIRHPDRPYDDPRVSRHVNDGRAFLRASDQHYDLVIFAQTDSLTLVTATANLRLESFLFTEEAFASVRDHLTDDGIFVLYNQYRQTWLAERIARELEHVFGSAPLLSSYSLGGDVNFAVFAAGPAIAALGGAGPPADTGGYRVVTEPHRPATDDWPFPYLMEPAIPGRYLLALAGVLVFGALVVGAAAHAGGRRLAALSPHFFALGVAFLLLETRSLVTFSLLFGTTWVVNALAFFAILVSVLAAIGVNSVWRVRDARWLYGGLAVALAAGYLLPPSSLLIDPLWLRYAIASTLAFAPIFFANLVFTYSFRDTDAADMAFASNLLGAMVGGALEWGALVTGYQTLMLMVGACYLLAYGLATRWRVLGDRRLRLAQPAVGREAPPKSRVARVRSPRR